MKSILFGIIFLAFVPLNTYSQSVCIIYKHDYGSAQDARINSLKHDVRFSQHQKKTLSYYKYDRASLESRSFLRNAILAKQSEYQRLANQPFRDKYHPNFEIRNNGN